MSELNLLCSVYLAHASSLTVACPWDAPGPHMQGAPSDDGGTHDLAVPIQVFFSSEILLIVFP